MIWLRYNLGQHVAKVNGLCWVRQKGDPALNTFCFVMKKLPVSRCKGYSVILLYQKIVLYMTWNIDGKYILFLNYVSILTDLPVFKNWHISLKVTIAMSKYSFKIWPFSPLTLPNNVTVIHSNKWEQKLHILLTN